MTIETLERAPTSGISEAEIVRGYRLGPAPAPVEYRTETCAWCLGVITAPADDDVAIGEAVRAHNLSTAHEQAARRLGYR